MPSLIPDEYSRKYRGLGWKIPENIEGNINTPHEDAGVTADDVYKALSNIDEDVLWIILNNDRMTFCPGMENA